MNSAHHNTNRRFSRGYSARSHNPGSYVGLITLAILHCSSALATTRTVTSTADSGPGTLREAIGASVAGDSINFSVTSPIVLTSGELDIGRDVTITGPPNGMVIERSAAAGTPAFRVFNITAGTVSVSNVTMSNGYAAGANGVSTETELTNGSPGFGGGVSNAGTLTLKNCSVLSSTALGGQGASGAAIGTVGGAGWGGGIYTTGTLTLNQCTVAGNRAIGGAGGDAFNDSAGNGGSGFGGAIYSGGTLALTNCSLSGNSAAGGMGGSGTPSGNGGDAGGGGLYDTAGSVCHCLNSIAAGGSLSPGGPGTGDPLASPGSASGPDASGAVSSQGHNLVGVTDASTGWTSTDFTGSQAAPLDPLLDPAGAKDNGGPSWTIALESGSPAIDAGSDVVLSTPYNLTTDAHGIPRKLGAHVDIGAFEYDPPQTGSTLVVNTLSDHADDGPGTTECTLREAIDAYNANTSYTAIAFKAGLTGTISLKAGVLTVSRNLTLTGPGARILTIDGGGSDSVFNLSNASGATSITVSGFTISDGSATSGGGILTNVNLTLTGCTFAHNTASYAGGAIYSSADSLTITGCTFNLNTVVGSSSGAGGALAVIGTTAGVSATNCTFTGNNAPVGGALYAGSSGGGATATLESCTIAGNTANIAGGGITNGGGAAITLKNTIVAGNTASNAGPDIYGTVISGGYNFIGKSDGSTGFTNGMNGDQVGTAASPLIPKLDTLKNNGGPTDTMALLSGSPCIDKGKTFGLATDQRGLKRPVDMASIANATGGDGSDIGAFEVQPPPTSQWQAVDVAIGSDNQARILWDRIDGASTLWSVNNSGAFTGSSLFGPYAGFTAKAITAGADGLTWALWSKADGTTALWLLGPQNNYETSYGYGPYSGWTPTDITVAADNQSRILWNNSNGQVVVWTAANNSVVSYGPVYGPYAGYTAKAIAARAGAGSDGITRVLWTKADGTMTLWLMSASNTYQTSLGFGPYSGWSAKDITVGSDNKARVLWTNTNGGMIVWTIANNGAASYGPVYGPYAGYTATHISVGADGLTRVLWNNTSGVQSLWLLNSSNVYQTSFGYGPY